MEREENNYAIEPISLPRLHIKSIENAMLEEMSNNIDHIKRRGH